MEPRTFLRVEAVAELFAALAVYFVILDGPVLLLVILVLAPDVSMLGYLAGPQTGSLVYNVAHGYTLPLALAGGGMYLESLVAVQLAAIWAVHIALDRTAGYGLKYPSGFTDTHLGRQPVVHTAFAADE